MFRKLVALVVFAGSAFASLSYDKDTGALASIDSTHKSVEDSQISLKELCYRNLYADVDEFAVKHSVETLVTDKEGSTVFLSDGIKRDFEDVEFYYEEWCYKQVKAREHDKDVQRTHALLVSRDYGSLLGLGGLESFAPASGFVATDGGGKGGASGLFAPGSFLAEFAQGESGGGFGFGDDVKGANMKGDEHKDGDKKGDDHGGVAKQPIGDGKAYGESDKTGDEHKDDGVKKRGFSWFRRVVIARE